MRKFLRTVLPGKHLDILFSPESRFSGNLPRTFVGVFCSSVMQTCRVVEVQEVMKPNSKSLYESVDE